jgi:hypothetical protein
MKDANNYYNFREMQFSSVCTSILEKGCGFTYMSKNAT